MGNVRLPAACALVSVTLATLCEPPPCGACQNTPRAQAWSCEYNAQLVPETPFVRSGQPFRVFLTLTSSDGGPNPPARPFAEDALFDVAAAGCIDTDGDGTWDPGPQSCRDAAGQALPGGASTAIDSPRELLLDHPWTPAPDDPTSATLAFTFVPLGPAESYPVNITASAFDATHGRVRWCTLNTCVPAVAEPVASATPSATFEDSVQSGAGGSVLPFSLRVQRNGYPSGPPLTVRVVPVNPYDPIDIFPIEPQELTTVGATVTGAEQLLTFQCHLHYPCFVGAYNEYDVTIHDGATPLWSSRWLGAPAARAFVDTAPLAHVELVDMEGAGCGRRLSSCEGGTVHLRLFARNPYYGVPLDDVALELPLPLGVTVARWNLHFHDNPMDAVTPPPGELAAIGVVTVTDALFRVEVPRIEPRYSGSPTPPRVFKDLFEVELYLDVPAGALEGRSELGFADMTVRGTAQGEAVSGTADTVRAEIGSPEPPAEVASARLRLLAHERLAWGPCEPSWSDTFNVYRGRLRDVHDLSGSRAGRCLATRIAATELLDAERPGVGDLFTYLVSGVNCAGEGSLGSWSMGPTRVPTVACP